MGARNNSIAPERVQPFYKLFIGFKELGKFDSILKAKQYASDSWLTGMFNLLGPGYWDSWYVFKQPQAEQKQGDNK